MIVQSSSETLPTSDARVIVARHQPATALLGPGWQLVAIVELADRTEWHYRRLAVYRRTDVAALVAFGAGRALVASVGGFCGHHRPKERTATRRKHDGRLRKRRERGDDG